MASSVSVERITEQMLSTASATLSQVAEGSRSEQEPRWSLTTQIAFRFVFVYFILYSLSNSNLLHLLPGINYLDPGARRRVSRRLEA